MSSSYISSPNEVDIIKSLLEQRTSRAELHRQYPSATYDTPDTPSVYTQFSPKSTVTPRIDSPIPPLPSAMHSNPNSPPLSTSAHEPSPRQNSMSDEDTRAGSSDDESYNLSRNFSLLGPKMKIHSSAPWETGSDESFRPSLEEDAKSFDAKSIFSSKRRGKSNERADSRRRVDSSLSIHSRRDPRPWFGLASNTVDSEKATKSSYKSTYPSKSSTSIVLPATTEVIKPHLLSEPSAQRHRTISQPSHIIPGDHHYLESFSTPPLHNANNRSQRDTSDLVDEVDAESERSYDCHPFADPDNLRNANRISAVPGQYLQPQLEDLPQSKGVPDYAWLKAPASSSSWGASRLMGGIGFKSMEDVSLHRNSHSKTANSGSIPSPKPKTNFNPSVTTFDNEEVDRTLNYQSTVLKSAVTQAYASQESAQPSRTLKPKKSGILRLFNKDKERQNTDPAKAQVPHSTAESQKEPLSPPIAEPLSHPKPPKRIPVTPINPTRVKGLRPPPLREIRSISASLVSEPPATGPSNRDLAVPAASGKRNDPKSAPASTTGFTSLSIRPMSMLFSDHFNEHLLPTSAMSERRHTQVSTTSSRSTLSTPLTSPLPATPTRSVTLLQNSRSSSSIPTEREPTFSMLEDKVLEQKTTWEAHISELENQVRKLKMEVDFLRRSEVCASCGAQTLKPPFDERHGILNRPRGTATRGTRTLFGGGRET